MIVSQTNKKFPHFCSCTIMRTSYFNSICYLYIIICIFKIGVINWTVLLYILFSYLAYTITRLKKAPSGNVFLSLVVILLTVSLSRRKLFPSKNHSIGNSELAFNTSSTTCFVLTHIPTPALLNIDSFSDFIYIFFCFIKTREEL